MSTLRVTQSMLVHRSVNSLNLGLTRLSTVQEQLSTGKRLNRPSDSPTDTSSAMRLRSSLKAVEQYGRNADDGKGRLGLVDQTLFGITDNVRRAREIALQGASTGTSDQLAREALATEVDQIRADLLGDSNTTYLTRPVFGGVTAGNQAYDSTGAFVGVGGAITRRVGEDVKVRVDVDGRSVFGDGATSVFSELTALSARLRAGDSPGLQTSLTDLATRLTTVSTVHSDVGASYKRIEQSQTALGDQQLYLTTALSDVEDVDLTKATVDLHLQEVAYQAALSATSRVIQPSLLDFLH
jgi:flagellar hook-associated protein 3 FlgL